MSTASINGLFSRTTRQLAQVRCRQTFEKSKSRTLIIGTELLHNIIDGSSFEASYRKGDMKLIWGDVGTLTGYYYPNGTDVSATVATGDYYLFDIASKYFES